MRCVKCGFITFDYLKDCPKCKTPVDAIVKELFPLQFKPSPPDFTKEYLEAIHGLSYVSESESKGVEGAQEVELEELSVEDVAAKEDLLKHFQTQEVSLSEISLKMEEQEEKQSELTLVLEQEGIGLKGKEPELEVELEGLVLEEDRIHLPDTIQPLSLEDEAIKATEPKDLEEPLLVLEEEQESMPKDEHLEAESKFLKIEDLSSLEEEEVKEIQIGIKLEDLAENGRE